MVICYSSNRKLIQRRYGENFNLIRPVTISEGSNSQSIQSHRGFFEEIRHIIHVCTSLSQQKSRIGNGSLDYPGNICRGHSLSSRISPHDIHRRSTGFLRILKQQKHCQLGLRGQRVDEMEESSPIPKVLQAGNRHVKLLTCKHILSFMKKQGWLQRQSPEHRMWSCKPQRIVLRLGNPTFAQLDFEVAWDW